MPAQLATHSSHYNRKRTTGSELHIGT